MTTEVIELAPIRLAKGKREADLLAASKAFQENFLAHQPGILARDLVRRGNGEFVDIVRWRSRAEAEAIGAKIEGSPEVQAYFAVMEPPEGDPAEAVEHLAVLARYG